MTLFSDYTGGLKCSDNKASVQKMGGCERSNGFVVKKYWQRYNFTKTKIILYTVLEELQLAVFPATTVYIIDMTEVPSS
jgi:hypothetical protein